MILPYNTDKKPIILPEFGRNIEGLINYCVSIPDRYERTEFAYALADVMANLFPELVGENGDMSKVWDEMNIISQFRLDVDFPYPVISEENIHPRPERLPYTSSAIRYRHYGKNIEKMIEVIADMPEGEERDQLISMVAHHMKKLMLIHNKEGMDNAKILRDLCEFSHGKINLDPNTYLLHEFKEAEPVVTPGKKKKKK